MLGGAPLAVPPTAPGCTCGTNATISPVFAFLLLCSRPSLGCSEGLKQLRMAVRGQGDSASVLEHAVACVKSLQVCRCPGFGTFLYVVYLVYLLGLTVPCVPSVLSVPSVRSVPAVRAIPSVPSVLAVPFVPAVRCVPAVPAVKHVHIVADSSFSLLVVHCRSK